MEIGSGVFAPGLCKEWDELRCSRISDESAPGVASLIASIRRCAGEVGENEAVVLEVRGRSTNSSKEETIRRRVEAAPWIHKSKNRTARQVILNALAMYSSIVVQETSLRVAPEKVS